ncbi:MAG: hypothetical protein R2699_16580 [Acidimicrobiales bacterium]
MRGCDAIRPDVPKIRCANPNVTPATDANQCAALRCPPARHSPDAAARSATNTNPPCAIASRRAKSSTNAAASALDTHSASSSVVATTNAKRSSRTDASPNNRSPNIRSILAPEPAHHNPETTENT